MAWFLGKVGDLIVALKNLEDRRMDDFFLMKSPLDLLGTITVYSMVVLKVGPDIMRNRTPFRLKKTIILYNLIQIIINAAMFFSILPHLHRMNIWCSPVDYSESTWSRFSIRFHYSYTMLKVFDFLETGIFVLRKKSNQVSVLHVYHHIGTFLAAWISCRYFPGGHGLFMAIPNNFVHMIMYIYYLFTALWPSTSTLWWKKYLTQLQILQQSAMFVIFFLGFINPKCSYPKAMVAIYLPNLGQMIALFVKFYAKTYKSKRHPL